MKRFIVLACTLLSLGAVHAANMTITKCFTRTYSDAHLMNNPDQLARSFKFAFSKDNNGNTYGLPFLRHKDGDGGFSYSATGGCFLKTKNSTTSTFDCGIDGDGGQYSIVVNGETATLKVKNSIALEGMGEDGEIETLLVKSGSANGIYKLKASPVSACNEIIK